MKPRQSDTLVTRADLGRRWKMHRVAVGRLFALPGAPEFDATGHMPSAIAEAWLAGQNERGQTMAEIRLRCEAAKANLLEHELSAKRADVVDRAEVLRLAMEDAALIRTSMLGMPNALAPQLVGLTAPEAVRAILADWARSTLAGWAAAAAGEIGKQVAAAPDKPAKKAGRAKR
jgi:hypothetical protein